MQNIRSGSNRIGAQKQRQPTFIACGNQTHRQSLVTHDAPVGAGLHFGFFNYIAGGKGFGSFSIIVPCLKHFHIAVEYHGLFAEFLLQKADGIFEASVIHPVDIPKHKHIFGTVSFFVTQLWKIFQGFARKLGNVYFKYFVAIETTIFQWVNAIRIICQAKIFGIKSFEVNDDFATWLDGFQIYL